MPGGSLGKSYVEIDMDFTPYTKAQKKLQQDAQSTSLNIEKNFKDVGIKSSREFDLMRQKITNAYNMIAHSSKATANDILRAEKAKNDQLNRLNEQQFGHQTTLIENLKNHWIAASVAIVAAWKFERMVSGWIKLADAQRMAEMSLKQAMISNERYSESAYQGMLKTASALQRITGVGDEAILAANTILQRFDKIPNELLPRVTKAMLDMGAATGNYANVARDLGRASEGMTETLRRQGIFLDEAVIKEKGFVGVLEEVEKKFGGQAELMAQGTGQWKVLGAAIGDAGEGLGKIFSEIATKSGVVGALTSAVNLLGDSFNYLGDQISAYDKIIERVNDKERENQRITEVYLTQMENYINYLGSIKTLAEQIINPLAALNVEMEKTNTENIPGKLGWADIPMRDPYSYMSGYGTFISYYRDILNEQNGVVSSLEINMNKLAEDYLKQLELVEKQRKEWESITSEVGDSLTDALVNSVHEGKKAFDDLGRHIIDMFLRMQIEKYITQPIVGAMNGMQGTATGFSKFLGSSALGMQGGATYGQMLGAGAVGFGMGGIGGGLGSAAGMFGGQMLGSMAGTAVGGAMGAALGSAIPIVGTVLGGVAGSYIAGLFEHDPPQPKIDLLYEVIEGKVKLISEAWENSPRSKELIDKIEETLQGQVDFFERIGRLTGSAGMAGVQFAFAGRTPEELTSMLPTKSWEMMVQNLPNLKTLMPKFEEAFSQIFMDMWGNITTENIVNFWQGRSGGYGKKTFEPGTPISVSMTSPAEALAAILGSSNPLEAYQQWLSSPISAMGQGISFSAMPGPMKTALTTPGTLAGTDIFRLIGSLGFSVGDMGDASKYLEKMIQELSAITDTLSQSIGGAFLDSLGTTDFSTFEDNLRNRLGQNIATGIAQSFTTNTIDLIMKGSTGLTSAFGLLNQFAAGESGVTFGDVRDAFNISLSKLDDTIIQLEPVFNEFNTWLSSITKELGVNTAATVSNTSAIMGPVNSLLMSLDTGPLAASQSLAGLENLKNTLYAGAINNPSEFGAYSSFLTSNYLPAMQGISGNYADVVAGVRSNVTSIPWVAQNMGTPSAKSIGFEVGQSLAPMLLDLKESGKITINVVVDGQVVKSSVIDALSDREVVATIQDM